MPTSFLASSEVSQDLREYFQRPRMIGTGPAPTGRQLITTRDIGLTFLTSSYPDFLIRIAGVYAIRFSLCFTVRISATPFNQGVLCASFQYGCPTNALYTYSRAANSFSADQLPCVTMNLEDSNEMMLKVPFLSTCDYFQIKGDTNLNNFYGHFSLNSLLPVPALTSSGPPQYRLYLHLEDLELLGVTSIVDNTALLNSGLHDSFNSSKRVIRKVSKGIATADKELRKSKVISSTLGFAGKALNMVSKVPVIGSFAGTPAWLATTLAKGAAAFGYSAPAMEEACQLKMDRQTLDPCHIDMPIASTKLSNFQSNKLEISEAMGASTEDQMSFAYILSKPSQIYAGSWSTGTAASSLVYGTKVSPMSFWFRSTGNGNIPAPLSSTVSTNCMYPSNVMNLADHFRYWRGGLTFHIEFSKTQFHAGQVLVTFIPFAESGSPNLINNTVRVPESSGASVQPNQFSMIIDLRSGNKFDFHVPFIFDFPYAGVNDSTGAFSMVVLNPLLASSTQISTSVDFLVRVSAREDFEFAAPVPPSFCTVATNNGDVFLQSGFDTMDNSDIVEAFAPETTMEASANIIGEKFNSLKQLAMIPTWFWQEIANLQIQDYIVPHWSYRPLFSMTTPMSTTASLRLATSHMNKVASMFVFSNGATRYTVQPQGTAPDFSIVAYFKSNPGNTGSASYAGFSNVRNKRLFSNSSTVISSDRTTTFDVPWYSRTQRVNHDFYSSTQFPRNFAGAPSVLDNTSTMGQAHGCVSFRNTSGRTVGLHMAYSAAEDATAVCFIGPSPVILFNSLATVSPNASTLYVEG